MLSDNIYGIAKRRLQNHETCIELLAYIWPVVKEHDFKEKKVVDIPMPRHLTTNGSNQELTPFSHSVIRKTVRALGFGVTKIQDKKMIHVTLKMVPATRRRKKS